MQRAEGKRLSHKRIALLIVTGLVLVFIFGQSLLPQSISAEESGWLTDHIVKPVLRLIGIELHGDSAVRKFAHAAEFTTLSVLLVFCFYGQIMKSAGVGFTAAFLDESIQLLSGRGALISDVWIDLIGVAAGSLLGYLLFRIIRRSQEMSRQE